VGLLFVLLHHWISSSAVRFGVVFVRLMLLLLLAFMWWRSSRELNRLQTTMSVMRWNGGAFSPYGGDSATGPYGNLGFQPGDVVDLSDARTQERQRCRFCGSFSAPCLPAAL